MALHDHGLAGEAFGSRPDALLRDCDPTALPPTLQDEIRRVVATHYLDVNFPPAT